MARTISKRRIDNLPQELTSFVGRRQESADVERLLADARLVTLTGPGGVGKTRLALRVAARKRRAFADGVWLIDVSTLIDGSLLPQAIAAVLRLRDEPARHPADTVTEYLRDRRLLLVLDNCEHVCDDCAVLAGRLLAASPGLKILATSRQPLGVPGEHVLPVHPLPAPATDELVPPERLARYDAVRLFVDRAAFAVPEFTLHAGNCAAVARLCRRLDGIPLAIELATVRLRALPVEQILRRIEDRLHLTDRSRSVPPRHQTLRTVIDWSHELCSPQERMLWARSSVFSGAYDLEAAEEVCSGDGIAREDVLDLVAGLVNKSILIGEDDGARVRYRMLDTIRRYGHEELARSGDEERVRRVHRDHYLRLSARARLEWFSPAQARWIDQVRRDLPDLRIAFEYSLGEPGPAHAAMEISAALLHYWIFHGFFAEGRSWLRQALERAPEPDPIREKASFAHAWVTLFQGDLPAALPLVEAYAAEARRLGTDLARVRVLMLRGIVAFFAGDLPEAISSLRTALERYEEDVEDPGMKCCAAGHLAIAAAFHGDDHAAAHAADLLELAEAAGAEVSVAWGLWICGLERWRRGDAPGAAALFHDSLRRQCRLNDRWAPTWGLEVLAWSMATAGRGKDAARTLGTAEGLRRSTGMSLPGPPQFTAVHGRYEARLRHALGDDAYTDAFEQGLRLSLEELLDDICETDTEPPPSAIAEPDPLTSREREVADLVAAGRTNKEIAAELVIAQRTAEGHVEHILAKLGFTSRAQIAVWYSERRRERSVVRSR